MEPCEYRETWWERLLFGLLALVVWSPVVGIVALAGYSVAKDYPPLEAPLEFIAYTLAVAGLLVLILAAVAGFLGWLLAPRKK